MANRGVASLNEFEPAAESLATSTLAYHLASEELKPEVKVLFVSVAQYLQEQEPAPEKQAVYSKTLLGVQSAQAVEQWVKKNRELLLTLSANEDWLTVVWSLLSEQSDDKFFHVIEPGSLPFQLATHWLQGHSYRELFAHSSAENGSKPWGEERRRRVTDDEIVSFCESTLGFECSLILAAVAQFLFGDSPSDGESSAALTFFQKALKYGLPDEASISCYECGFADRVLAQHLCDAVRAEGFSGSFFREALAPHRDRIETVLANYPSYFESVLSGLGSREST